MCRLVFRCQSRSSQNDNANHALRLMPIDDIEEMRKEFLKLDSSEVLELLMTPEQFAEHQADLKLQRQRWEAMPEKERNALID